MVLRSEFGIEQHSKWAFNGVGLSIDHESMVPTGFSGVVLGFLVCRVFTILYL